MRTAIAVMVALLLPAGTLAAPNNAELRGTKAYCYYKQTTHTWRIGNDAIERAIHFDAVRGGLETTQVRAFRHLPQLCLTPMFEGRIELATDRGPRRLDLSADWVFQWQSVSTRQHGGRLLTIHMQGKAINQGFELEAMYEVLPGNRPFFAKTFTVINRSGEPVTVREVVYDRWSLTRDARSKASPASHVAGTTASLTVPKRGSLSVGFDAAGGASTLDGSVIRACASVEIAAAPSGGRAYLPTEIVAVSAGSEADSAALLQRYVPESHAVVVTGPRL